MKSLTGYASLENQGEGLRWQWELRSVNGKGLDLRIRIPDWCSAMEAEMRKRVGAEIARGNVTIGLRIYADGNAPGTSIDTEHLDRTLDLLALVQERAAHRGLALGATSAADVLGMRGVLSEDARNDGMTDALSVLLLGDFDVALQAFVDSRAAEGAALSAVITRHLDAIAEQLTSIRAILPARADAQAEVLRAGMARLLETEQLDAGRLHQEAAMLAVKSDVTEELDRLDAHVAAARQLVATDVPIGRKFDFLCQEFNREANTLCSKSQHSGLTELGLEMKVTIDQMREQIQNVE
ncbi:YicC/YloC family endoribonuclease [Donghicola sp. XS_ASV15]|uniref:YicC/YloC family endoribonuclease n=1 Tax=Donghicola sp. XS_ASV15 TaxID=3241295 RepID=UPI003515654E